MLHSEIERLRERVQCYVPWSPLATDVYVINAMAMLKATLEY